MMDSNNTELVAECASEIKLERVTWLWDARLALGKHTCIAGEPGTGKSQLATMIAATVTMGGSWPCNEGSSPQGGVIILSAEDDPGDTIVPRLIAAGADLGRVHIVTAVRDADETRGINLQADLTLIENKLKAIGDVKLVIIDPISSYLGKTDSHKNADVRGVLEPLSAMASRARVAVLSVTHFSKTGAANNSKALHRFIGSIAFVGAPRMAFAVIEDADNPARRLFLHAKNNLGPSPQGLAFKLKQTIIDKGIVASCVEFDGEPVTMTADSALADASGGSLSRCEDAEEFLAGLLAEGPVPTKQVKSDAEGAGLAWITVRRAKDRLGVKARKTGKEGHWEWSLPKVFNPDSRCSSENMSTLSTFKDSQGFAGDETPKVLIDIDEHVDPKNGFELPDLPACLSRRKRP